MSRSLFPVRLAATMVTFDIFVLKGYLNYLVFKFISWNPWVVEYR